MAIPTANVAVGGAIHASTMVAVITQVNAIALIGQIPTVAGTGQTVSPGGTVSFTNAASVIVVGAFNSTYDNYRIVWNIPSQTASADLEMRLSNVGVGDTNANYSYSRGYDSFTAGTRTVSGATASSAWLLTAGAAASQTNDGYMDIYGPALSQYTNGLAQAVVHNSVPNMYTTSTQIYNSTATAYDGFEIFPASGTISGRLRIYGYNNLA